ncbi:aspartyl-phosphate phosphatase Spo0E family protein [Psychrobacillus sp. FSL H8-0484]
MHCFMNENALDIRIETKRKNMYKLAKKLGFTHPLVVSISQELDALLNLN